MRPTLVDRAEDWQWGSLWRWGHPSESRVLTWSYRDTRLWDITKPEPLQTFKHNSDVFVVQFSRDESRVLAVSDSATWTWDIADPLIVLTPTERMLELEVRSGSTLNEQQNLRTLTFDEWQDKVKSAEYRAIEKKLESHSTKPAPQAHSVSHKPADAEHRAKPPF